MARAPLQFWFEFASTYSYPAASRVGALAAAAGAALEWRPFLLGPIFRDQGWNDSPFNVYPVKGRYMWRDLERLCAAHEPGKPRGPHAETGDPRRQHRVLRKDRRLAEGHAHERARARDVVPHVRAARRVQVVR